MAHSDHGIVPGFGEARSGMVHGWHGAGEFYALKQGGIPYPHSAGCRIHEIGRMLEDAFWRTEQSFKGLFMTKKQPRSGNWIERVVGASRRLKDSALV
ncbi:hypothetical protein CR155_09850 [Pollutimonas nitritireducens]|uniref:Uncharacterized protein n=1 Tax=Pollutimonas nitritireducens TaxID=2045209 RepID=A0A2N4UFF3_9BURK|nr:hypothetical protein [Pollutimonas nitritireducens]PLC53752.1 hypothetical protein CR155_09850 [Pollutimonas nitritireducens]